MAMKAVEWKRRMVKDFKIYDVSETFISNG